MKGQGVLLKCSMQSKRLEMLLQTLYSILLPKFCAARSNTSMSLISSKSATSCVNSILTIKQPSKNLDRLHIEIILNNGRKQGSCKHTHRLLNTIPLAKGFCAWFHIGCWNMHDSCQFMVLKIIHPCKSSVIQVILGCFDD